MTNHEMKFSYLTYSFYFMVPLMIFFSVHLQDALFVGLILTVNLFICAVIAIGIHKIKDYKLGVYIFFIIYFLLNLSISQKAFMIYGKDSLTLNYFWIFTFLSSPAIFLLVCLKDEFCTKNETTWKTIKSIYGVIYRYLFKMILMMITVAIIRETLYSGGLSFYWQHQSYYFPLFQGFLDYFDFPYLYKKCLFFETPAGGILTFTLIFLFYIKIKRIRFK